MNAAIRRVAFSALPSLAACGELIGLDDLERRECLDVCTEHSPEQGGATSGAGSGGQGGSAATALGGTLDVVGGGAPPAGNGGTTGCDVPGETNNGAPNPSGGAGAASGGTFGGVSGGTVGGVSGGGAGPDDGAGVGGQAPTAGSGPIALPIRINFQPLGADVPPGYTPDIGLAFTPQDGLSFGWSVDHTDVTRDRGVNSNQLLDTLCQFHEGASWELALPNGTYSVLVSVGDPSLASIYTLVVEGVTYWRGRAIGANQFMSTNSAITVTDGRLTLTQGSASELATRINFIEVSAP